MSQALPGNHYCTKHQGNHSHYAEHNCDLCQARDALERLTLAIAPRTGLAADIDVYPEIRAEYGGAVAEGWALARRVLA
jgi:hypothetical protein